ncbi:MAG: hypothetical protein JXB35_10480 [Anaerolineae bacterium]|nr:hypothetical protein [Anaerolineae bacterium]
MRDLERAFRSIRKKGSFLRGLLGDFEGNIEVNGRPGYYYVRVEKPGGYEVGIFPGRVRPLYNLPVRIETHPITRVQYIAGLDDETVAYGGGDPGAITTVERHQQSHGWGGDDQLMWLHTLQIFPVRCQPHETDPDSVVIQGGVYLSEAQLSWMREPATVDLSVYRITGVRFVLLELESDNNVVVTPATAEIVEEISLPTGGRFLVAAVCLRNNDAIAMHDIVDLRFLNSGVVNGGIEIGEDMIIVGDLDSGRWVKVGYLGDALLGMDGRFTGTLNADDTDFAGVMVQRTASDESRAMILWGDNDESETGLTDYLWFVFFWHGDDDVSPQEDPEARYLARVSPNGTWTFYGQNSGGVPHLIKNEGGDAGAMAENDALEHGAWWLDTDGDLHFYNYETGKDVILGSVDGVITIRDGDLVMEAGAEVDGVDVSAHAADDSAHHERYTDAEAQAVADAQIAAHTTLANPHGTEMDDLDDVDAGAPSDGDVLTWDDAAGCWAPEAPGSGGSITVQEADGSPAVSSVTTIKVGNGDLADEGSGVVRIKTASDAGGSGSENVGSTLYLFHNYF